jgi:hypothetical protein
MITAICEKVERSSRDGRECLLVIASSDVQTGTLGRPPIDENWLTGAKNKLASMGLKLGGAPSTKTPEAMADTRNEYPAPPVDIHVNCQPPENDILAEQMEVYELSSGSTIVFLYVFDMRDNLQWMIGKRIELQNYGQRLSSTPVQSSAV